MLLIECRLVKMFVLQRRFGFAKLTASANGGTLSVVEGDFLN